MKEPSCLRLRGLTSSRGVKALRLASGLRLNHLKTTPNERRTLLAVPPNPSSLFPPKLPRTKTGL